VRYAVLFNRRTPLWAGMVSCIEMFAPEFWSGLSEDVRSHVINAVEERLRPTLCRDGNWIADYRRIRVLAIKNSSR